MCLDVFCVYVSWITILSVLREIHDNIEDNHLRHDLKRHPFTQARKGQVCFLFLSAFHFGINIVCVPMDSSSLNLSIGR